MMVNKSGSENGDFKGFLERGEVAEESERGNLFRDIFLVIAFEL